MRVALVSLFTVALYSHVHAGQSFAELALHMRHEALLRYSGPPVMTAAPPRPAFSFFSPRGYPWHSCTSTIFSVWEDARQGGGITNARSAWDPFWREHSRSGQSQSWYIALPYNDCIDSTHSKPEAA